MNDNLINEWLKHQQAKEKSCIHSQYRHFDLRVSLFDYMKGGKFRDDLSFSYDLAKYKWWPLIRIDQKKRRFTKDLQGKLKIKQKLRKIMFPSHRDACIMSFYAFLLKKNYELAVQNTSLDECVIGYRRIPVSTDQARNKSNIHFADELYKSLNTLNGYTVLCIDIKGFFDNINHEYLKQAVSQFTTDIPLRNLDVIIRAVTDYRFVFRNDIKRLLGDNSWANPAVFNRLIRDAGYVHKNKNNYGIPQGTPISDILSNIYLFDFDKSVACQLSELKAPAIYKRYCDDILIAVPSDYAENTYDFIVTEIEKYKLNIGLDKTEAFYVDASLGIFEDITKKYVSKYARDRQFLQYLGFYINLDGIYIRSSTIENHYRKLKHIKGTRRNADGTISRKPLDNYERLCCDITNADSIARQYTVIQRRSRKILKRL